MAVWLELLQSALEQPPPVGIGPRASVRDDAFTLCRVVIVIAAAFARWDAAVGELVGSVLDVNSAMGPALEVLGYRRGVKRNPGVRSIVSGLVFGTPGTQVAGVVVKDTVEAPFVSPANTEWQLPEGLIPAGGFLDITATALVDGPLVGTQGNWTPSTTNSGVSKFVCLDTIRVGNVVEPIDTYRGRVLAARGVRCATEPAIAKRLRETPGCRRAIAYVNRKSVEVDGIPPHHIAAVVDGGSDQDIATTLRDIAASATAGFVGTVTVSLPHPQGPEVGSTDVAFSRSVDLRGYTHMTVQVSDAPTQLSNNDKSLLRRRIAGLVDEWTQTLVEGQLPLASECEAYVRDRLPKGIITQISALFSRVSKSLFDCVNIITLARHERFRCTSIDQPAIIIGSKGEPFSLPAGNLDLSVSGGPTQTANFLGTEVAMQQVLGTLAGAGLTGVIGTVSIYQTLQLQTTTTGSLASLAILGTSSAGLLSGLGLSVGSVSGAFEDTLVLYT